MFNVPDIKHLLKTIEELLPLTKEAANAAKQSLSLQREMIEILKAIHVEMQSKSPVSPTCAPGATAGWWQHPWVGAPSAEEWRIGYGHSESVEDS